MHIACLHTAESNVALFEDALFELGLSDQATLHHEVRVDLLADAERAGGLTPEITERTREALVGLRSRADAVVLTCSTLGPAVDSFEEDGPSSPVLRADAALAREAVKKGGRVVVLVAVETTVDPTRRLFEAAAATTGALVEVRLVPQAWAEFKAGNRDAYLRLIREAADRAMAEGAETVALAQVSMAGAAAPAVGASPLAIPTWGLRDAIARIAEARSARDRASSDSARPTIAGSCLCGAVRYEASDAGVAVHCHCSRCRKWHGAAFASIVRVPLDALRVVRGEESIRRFASSPGVTRCFCKVCGSSLYTLRTDLGRAHIRLGTVDGDPGVRPSLHAFVGSKAPWFPITDSLPQHASSSVVPKDRPRG
jgi:hypothetical protein